MQLYRSFMYSLQLSQLGDHGTMAFTQYPNQHTLAQQQSSPRQHSTKPFAPSTLTPTQPPSTPPPHRDDYLPPHTTPPVPKHVSATPQLTSVQSSPCHLWHNTSERQVSSTQQYYYSCQGTPLSCHHYTSSHPQNPANVSCEKKDVQRTMNASKYLSPSSQFRRIVWTS